MKKIILISLLSALLTLVINTIILAFSGTGFESVGMLIYFMILVYGGIIIPTAIAVVIHGQISNLIKVKNVWLKFIITSVLLGTAIQIGLFLWSTLDVYLWHKDLTKVSLDRIINDYRKEFLPWISFALSLAFIIPVSEIIIAKRTTQQTPANIT